MLLSIIIPVYNRPVEIDELLASLAEQTRKDFEVIVIDDGSSDTSEQIVSKYFDKLAIKYFTKPNSGPGLTRNYGAERSSAEYLIFLDSDCVLPPSYMDRVVRNLENSDIDAFGGPDKAHKSFTNTQKAINYSMTSFFTTGGIRGGRRKMDKFFPRSFNMGIKKSVFEALGGFSTMRFGEDIDLSTRIYEQGYSAELFVDAWVYHKRRTDFKKFFKQVYNSGIARVIMLKKRPKTLKLVYLLPAIFTVGGVVILIGGGVYPPLLLLLLLFAMVIFIDASVRTKSVAVGALSVIASYVQLAGYGSGFLAAAWRVLLLKQEKYTAFENTFYK